MLLKDIVQMFLDRYDKQRVIMSTENPCVTTTLVKENPRTLCNYVKQVCCTVVVVRWDLYIHSSVYHILPVPITNTTVLLPH
jgi:hypothetical protein